MLKFLHIDFYSSPVGGVFLIAGPAICLLHVEICNGNPPIRVQCGHTVLFRLEYSFCGFVFGSSRTHCAACQLGRWKLRQQHFPRPVFKQILFEVQ